MDQKYFGELSIIGMKGCDEFLSKVDGYLCNFRDEKDMAKRSLSIVLVALCNPRDCSLPQFSVHGILQARILAWGAMPSSRGSSQSRDQTQVSCMWADSLPSEPRRKSS